MVLPCVCEPQLGREGVAEGGRDPLGATPLMSQLGSLLANGVRESWCLPNDSVEPHAGRDLFWVLGSAAKGGTSAVGSAALPVHIYRFFTNVFHHVLNDFSASHTSTPYTNTVLDESLSAKSPPPFDKRARNGSVSQRSSGLVLPSK